MRHLRALASLRYLKATVKHAAQHAHEVVVMMALEAGRHPTSVVIGLVALIMLAYAIEVWIVEGRTA